MVVTTCVNNYAIGSRAITVINSQNGILWTDQALFELKSDGFEVIVKLELTIEGLAVLHLLEPLRNNRILHPFENPTIRGGLTRK